MRDDCLSASVIFVAGVVFTVVDGGGEADASATIKLVNIHESNSEMEHLMEKK